MEITNQLTNPTISKQLATSASQDLGKAEFLQLLVAQLRNQDPLSPMEGQEFAAQLAQFSSVEQLTSIDSSLKDGIDTDLMLTQAVNNTLATNFIGKQVASLGNQVSLLSGESASVNFYLADYAQDVKVKIYDEAGNLVRTMEYRGMNSGKQSLEWDGLNENEEQLPGGNYTFQVEATNSDGDTLDVTTFTRGLVSAVRYSNGTAVLVVNGKEIPLSDVLEIG